ncbi:DUF6861 domain-containing protein [Pseudomonas sp. RIT-PI-S]|uniref:DUF6861 domain-containing protein n=1 Tax=Pseudomonas sp. RIT-PI-S TaxID=3035295 RepID=UPI0021D92563|nr:glycine zipper family protein [Pseudomonas sp. RIT-PI-S]
MDFSRSVPSWDDVERNLDQTFNALNQSVHSGFQSAHDGWNGFTRRASNTATLAYGYAGGSRIDAVRLAMAKSYPIIQANLMRKWASIEIEQILPVLMQVIREVVMIVGSSVAIGALAGGAAGSMALGAGAAPGAMLGGGIGLQVGNLILMALGLGAISEYFCKGLMPCLSTLYDGITSAWHAEEGLQHPDLDPTGGSAALKDERIGRAARQLARGQEQLVLLLLTAIVTYLTRGQIKAGVLSSMESIATRSASLRAGMPNKELAAWLARNEQKMLANPELSVNEPAPLAKVEPAPLAQQKGKESPKEKPSTFEEMYAKAGATKAEIDTLADNLAAQYGGTVAKAPIKSRMRALQKIMNDYGGDATRIKDLARNTIVVPAEKISAVAAELAQRGADVKSIDGSLHPLGYSGVNSSMMTKTGLIGEIQVNSPQMIFAKEPEALARNLLGSETYDAVAAKAGVPGGLGHRLYEDWRVLDPSAASAKAIAEESKAYYNAVRGLNGH